MVLEQRISTIMKYENYTVYEWENKISVFINYGSSSVVNLGDVVDSYVNGVHRTSFQSAL